MCGDFQIMYSLTLGDELQVHSTNNCLFYVGLTAYNKHIFIEDDLDWERSKLLCDICIIKCLAINTCKLLSIYDSEYILYQKHIVVQRNHNNVDYQSFCYFPFHCGQSLRRYLNILFKIKICHKVKLSNAWMITSKSYFRNGWSWSSHGHFSNLW